MRIPVVGADVLRQQRIRGGVPGLLPRGLLGVTPVARVLLFHSLAHCLLMLVVGGSMARRLLFLGQHRHLVTLAAERVACLLGDVVGPHHNGLSAMAVAQRLVEVRGAVGDAIRALPMLLVFLERRPLQPPPVRNAVVERVELRVPPLEDPSHEALELRRRPIRALPHQAALGLRQRSVKDTTQGFLAVTAVAVPGLLDPRPPQVFPACGNDAAVGGGRDSGVATQRHGDRC
mmetsp:Transcript_11700/g.33681  ORF Transcript_11700/g.33681 Transcript_11700/m.33681 type:complete len:232 (+) Transcript_11700:1048-1743(+)